MTSKLPPLSGLQMPSARLSGRTKASCWRCYAMECRQAQKCRLPRWSRHLMYPLRQCQLAWKPRYPSDRPPWQSRRRRAVGLRLKRVLDVTGLLRVPRIVPDARSFKRPDQTTSVRGRLWVVTAWFIRSATRPTLFSWAGTAATAAMRALRGFGHGLERRSSVPSAFRAQDPSLKQMLLVLVLSAMPGCPGW